MNTLVKTNTAMTTIGKVFEKVDELSKACWDDSVPVKDISFDNLETINIGSEKHQMKVVAQMEMAFRLGIPIVYLRKCSPDVQAYNMNHWIKKERNEELFIRFNGDEVRAIFTPRYIPVDNHEILERLNQIGYGPETSVQCHLDGEFMLLSIPNSKETFKINSDKMTPGISIHNSEVGLAAVGFSVYILRLVCTNGLVVPVEMNINKYRHVSRKVLDEFPEIISSLANGLSDQQRMLKFSMGSHLDNPIATIEQFIRQFQLGKQEREALEWAWPLEQGSTMFHIIQTYTRAAQYEGLNAEVSYRLQRTGGSILSMLH
jgi:Domain of unknown function (DUF932)